MTRIRFYAHPLDGRAEVFEVPSLGEWLLEHFGEQPQVGVQVFAGEPSAETDITGNVEATLSGDAPEYVVLQSPGATIGFLGWIQIISFVFTVYSVLSASSPTMPANVNRTQQSPNNSLGSRENQVRVGQRVEDIFGTLKAIPSLMMPTYNKYFDNTKYEYGYYCISRGYIDAADISDGDSLIADITGASAAVYWPFTSPNSGAPVIEIGTPISDGVLTVARSNQIDGVTLQPLNALQFTPGEHYFFEADPAGDIIRQDHKAPNFNSLLDPGDQIIVSNATGALLFDVSVDGDHAGSGFSGDFSSAVGVVLVGDSVIVSSTVDSTNDGTYTVTSVSTTFLGVTPAPVTRPSANTRFRINYDYSGTYDIAGVADGFIVLTTSTFRVLDPVSALVPISADIVQVTVDPITEWTDWVTLADKGRTEVWFNMLAANGLGKDDGGMSSITVEFEAEIEKLDPGTLLPTGIVETATGSLTGSVTEERAVTVEQVTSWVGAARTRMRRTSQRDYDFPGRVNDEIKWADLYSVTPTDRLHFGNKTTIHTITQATSRSTAVKTRQLNCIASRRIPIWNGISLSGAFDDSGRHVAGTIAQSSRLVDIIAAVAADRRIGDRDVAVDLDMPQIYGVQQLLDAWHAEAGQFNYTFDSDNISFEETVQIVANAGFCTAYRQNGQIRLALDRLQAASTALFCHRNKQPNAESITRKFANDGDFDGVEFAYTDPDSNQTETIKLPLDGSARVPKKFEMPGIRSFAQAWLRANREFYKLFGQRVTIETGTFMDARSLLPNARVDIVDNTRFKSFDGEVIGQSGLTLTLSRDVAFSPGEPHSVVLMRRDGSVQGIPVTPGPSSWKVVLAYAPSEAIVTVPSDAGIRTIFSFASDSRRRAMAYLVQEIDLSDGQYAKVKGVNYSDSYYQADHLAIPDKAGIIN